MIGVDEKVPRNARVIREWRLRSIVTGGRAQTSSRGEVLIKWVMFIRPDIVWVRPPDIRWILNDALADKNLGGTDQVGFSKEGGIVLQPFGSQVKDLSAYNDRWAVITRPASRVYADRLNS